MRRFLTLPFLLLLAACSTPGKHPVSKVPDFEKIVAVRTHSERLKKKNGSFSIYSDSRSKNTYTGSVLVVVKSSKSRIRYLGGKSCTVAGSVITVEGAPFAIGEGDAQYWSAKNYSEMSLDLKTGNFNTRGPSKTRISTP